MGRTGISKDDLINEVLKLKEELGRMPTLKEYDEKYHHRGMINSRFGTWNKFLRSVGLEPVQRYYEGELCHIKGCKNKAQSKGLCRRHYDQKLKANKIYDRTRFDGNEIIKRNSYAEIITYSGEDMVKDKVLIDSEYVEKIKNYKVYVDRDGYATVTIEQDKVHLTEFLFGKLNSDEYYSYKNKNTLDCRKENIIIVDRAEMARRNKLDIRNKTGVKGVIQVKRTGKYQVSIGHNRKTYHLGTYDTLAEAKQARIQGEIKYWGKVYTKNLGSSDK